MVYVFLIWCVCIGFCIDESTHELFNSRFSFPYSSMVFLDVFPISFQSQVFLELVSHVQNLRVGVTDVKFKSLAPQGKALYL